MATETVLIDFQVDYTELTNAQAELAKTGKIDTKGFDAIQAAIDTTATDTKGLIKTFKDVAGASVKMGKTVEDAFGAGIQDALDEAGVSVEEFAAALKKANTPATSLKKELLQLKESMARMKAEGKDTGKEFDALRQRAGKLSDAIADANAEIKNAGSDTRGIDNVVGSISALAGGYAAVQGAAALFGEESEDLQKALLKVNGAMALASGLQQTMNALQREGALVKLADSAATGAQVVATKLYTFVMAGATTATRVLRAALIATGIGAIVVLVMSLVSALIEYSESADDGTLSTEDFNKALEAQNRLLKENIEQLEASARLNASRLKGQGADALRLALEELKVKKKVLAQLEAAELQARKDANRNRQMENKEALDNIQSLADQVQAKRNEIALFQSETINLAAELDRKAAEDARKKQEEYDKKKLEALKKSQADLLAQQKIADANWIKTALDRVNKEIEAERIKYDNFEDMRAQEAAKRKKDADDWAAQWKSFQDSLVKSSEDAAAKIRAAEDAALAQRVKNAQISIEIGTQVASIYNQISQAQTDRDKAAIQSQRERIQNELAAGVISQKQAEARYKQVDILSRRAANAAAKREKQAAVFTALLAIPKAFLQGLSQGGIKLAVVYAALAAVEAALIASKPVPRFFRGKKDKYSGPGIVADVGSEIVERDGRMYLYTKPTQTYLGANDKVYTASETRNIMHNTNVNTTVRHAQYEKFDYNRLAKSIPVSTQVVNIDKDFISESVANGLSRVNYMDRRYSSRK